MPAVAGLLKKGFDLSLCCTKTLSAGGKSRVHPSRSSLNLCGHRVAIGRSMFHGFMSTGDARSAPPGAALRQSDGAAPDEGGLRERKMALRKLIKAELKGMNDSSVEDASRAVAERLLKMPQLTEDIGEVGAVSVYLSMPGELGTSTILRELFKRGKKIYIPKVLGPAPADMRMFPLESEEEVKSFPLTKWKIPEPSMELVLSREDGVLAGDIDVVVVPGMAFDARCNRLGHGKGYYDCFFERVRIYNKEKGRPPPTTMGVCFDEQVVDSVPTSSMDVPLDFVFTPSRTLRRGADSGDP